MAVMDRRRGTDGHGSSQYLVDRGSKKRLARITIRNSTPTSFWFYVILAIAFLALAVPWIARQHELQHQTRAVSPK
jgi:hypothetical protein